MNNHTYAFLSALSGVDAVHDWRAMHDRDRGRPAVALRGTVHEVHERLVTLNADGYGVHVMINETDGAGQTVGHVTRCRAQLLDLDGIDAGQQLGRVLALGADGGPHWYVNTSSGRVQVWWRVTEHADKQLYSDNQRRLAGEYHGDAQFVDCAHTARVPGFYHCKGAPTLVTIAAGPLWGHASVDPWAIAARYLHVPLAGASGTDRRPLGHAPWQAPSLEWIGRALWAVDPNALRRDEWIALTAATKQAGWSHGPDAVRALWDAWCAWYRGNDVGENNKQWNSIDETASGWALLVKRSGLAGELMAAGLPVAAVGSGASAGGEAMPGDEGAMSVGRGDWLDAAGQAEWFKGCVWVTSVGRILGPNGRLMDTNKFDAVYGGPMFMLDAHGERKTDSPWKAATKGQAFSVPRVDHMRFLPMMECGAVVRDEFGELGVNMYRAPERVECVEGVGIEPFMEHVRRLLPHERDQRILLAFLAQCVQRPGVKVGWAVLLQSMEGAGKTVFRQVLEAALGRRYVHSPNARELGEGGGKFNGWMREKLMMIVDEVRTDERRELIEVMKPWITEYMVEIQNKGADQEMADNPTNWLLFSNYKDAVPIDDRSRRYAVLYCAVQGMGDLERLGMDGEYFTRLYGWSKAGGAAAVAEWLRGLPVDAEFDAAVRCTRAPRTSSTDEAIAVSRGWLETIVLDAVDDELQGFRKGWVSTIALNNLIRQRGERVPGGMTIAKALEALGYHKLGRSGVPYFQEASMHKSTLYNLKLDAGIANYARDQGYLP